MRSRLEALSAGRGSLLGKATRYSLVSGASILITQVLLIGLKGGLEWPGATANVVAVSVAAVPAYVLNRYWVWSKRGRNHLWREIAPFWGMALLGLAFSTWLVAVADRTWGTVPAVSLANLLAFGLIWIGKFAVLDRVLFASRPAEGNGGQ
ncbi:MAG TPA: GtrA family protein [Actinomycetota bacterium]|nr:GtrA family protein [Actinomycetota bacterium]